MAGSIGPKSPMGQDDWLLPEQPAKFHKPLKPRAPTPLMQENIQRNAEASAPLKGKVKHPGKALPEGVEEAIAPKKGAKATQKAAVFKGLSDFRTVLHANPKQIPDDDTMKFLSKTLGTLYQHHANRQQEALYTDLMGLLMNCRSLTSDQRIQGNLDVCIGQSALCLLKIYDKNFIPVNENPLVIARLLNIMRDFYLPDPKVPFIEDVIGFESRGAQLWKKIMVDPKFKAMSLENQRNAMHTAILLFPPTLLGIYLHPSCRPPIPAVAHEAASVDGEKLGREFEFQFGLPQHGKKAINPLVDASDEAAVSQWSYSKYPATNRMTQSLASLWERVDSWKANER